MAPCNNHTKLGRRQEQSQQAQQLTYPAGGSPRYQNQQEQQQHIEEWRRTTMVSVQGVGCSSSEFTLVENKGRGGTEANQSEADFFDEFVVLDGADAASASTLLSHGLANTVAPLGLAGEKQRQTQNRGGRGAGGGQHTIIGPQHQLDVVDMGGLPPHYHDTPGMGSISDSELLRLEGLTMRSPRPQMAATSASEPASPPSRSISPRKAGRLEVLYTKARAKVATLQGKGKPPRQYQAPPPAEARAPIISTAFMNPAKPSSRSRPHSLHIEKTNAPLSPPLTNSAAEGNTTVSGHGSIHFDLGVVHGFFSGQTTGGTPDTPLDTPVPDGIPATALSSVLFGNSTAGNDGVWWDPAMDNGMQMEIDSPDFFTTPTSYKAGDFQLALRHLQQQGYPPETLNDATAFRSSGLVIHMPQPHGPAPAVLHPSVQPAAARPQPARFPYPPPPPPPLNSVSARPGRAQDGNPSPRRPKPRAPSSGARHHHFNSSAAATTAVPPATPRKARTASGSGSVPTTPTTATGAPGRLHRRSASMQALGSAGNDPAAPSSSIRKRKSWTGRRVSSSHNDGAHSASMNGSPRKGTHHSRRASAARISSASLAAAAAAGAADIEDFERGKEVGGFVNYTPDDHRVLMTGVAPSGSSKTKARREREAAEQKRKTLEAVRKVVVAAGGDISKLDMEGEGVGLGGWLEGKRDG